jgi:hypothetical protein
VRCCIVCGGLVLAPAIHHFMQEMKESSSDTMFYVFGGTEPQVTLQLQHQTPSPSYQLVVIFSSSDACAGSVKKYR